MCAPPTRRTRPCALRVRHYAAMLIAAVLHRQSSCRDPGTLTTTGTHALVQPQPKLWPFIWFFFGIQLFLCVAVHRLYCTPACGSIFFPLSADLKWSLVAVSSQWLLRGLPSCGLSVVAERVAWSSPEEAPLCWMDVSEAALDSEYWWRRW